MKFIKRVRSTDLDDNGFKRIKESFEIPEIDKITKFIEEAINEKVEKENNNGNSEFNVLKDVPFFIDNLKLKIRPKEWMKGTCELKMLLYCEG